MLVQILNSKLNKVQCKCDTTLDNSVIELSEDLILDGNLELGEQVEIFHSNGTSEKKTVILNSEKTNYCALYSSFFSNVPKTIKIISIRYSSAPVTHSPIIITYSNDNKKS